MARKNEARIRFVHRCGYALFDMRPPHYVDNWRETQEYIVMRVGKVVQRNYFDDEEFWGDEGYASIGAHDAVTYTWECRCRQTVTMKSYRLTEIWVEYLADPSSYYYPARRIDVIG